jgi:folate-binding protein YgfZ
MSKLIRLENRAVVEIGGPDARDFLQGIITNDINALQEHGAIYAGLLTPQGKLLFDFFIIKTGNSYLFDVDAGQLPDFIKRLTFYKLRANVEISTLEKAAICTSLDDKAQASEGVLVYPDPRYEKMGDRLMVREARSGQCATNVHEWHAHRIHFGIPEAGYDFTYGNCFPHDIAMDQLNGIGFKKGCYVGQEVVSRMQHRGTARKRPMIVRSAEKLPESPTNIEAQGVLIGQLRSVSDHSGLAEIRIDRAVNALDEGKTFDVNGIRVELVRPQWATYGMKFRTIAQ